jgi:hypothetical protein
MNEEQVEPSQVGYGHAQPSQDRHLHEYRLDLNSIIRDMRTTMTGERLIGGKWERVTDEGMVCRKHWERYNSSLLQINKGMMLSRIPEEVGERLTIRFGHQTQAWLCSNCLFCPNCRFGGHYGTVSLITDAVTNIFYTNIFRAVGGWEADKIGTMHHVTTHERWDDDKKSKGWFRGGRG